MWKALNSIRKKSSVFKINKNVTSLFQEGSGRVVVFFNLWALASVRPWLNYRICPNFRYLICKWKLDLEGEIS